MFSFKNNFLLVFFPAQHKLIIHDTQAKQTHDVSLTFPWTSESLIDGITVDEDQVMLTQKGKVTLCSLSL
jgi:hypothetical protein